jgi:hypothetical protein
MFSKLETIYEKVTDAGVSINDLYIYGRVIEDFGIYGSSSQEMEEIFQRIKTNHANDDEWRSLDYHINAVLNDGSIESIW